MQKSVSMEFHMPLHIRKYEGTFKEAVFFKASQKGCFLLYNLNTKQLNFNKLGSHLKKETNGQMVKTYVLRLSCYSVNL